MRQFFLGIFVIFFMLTSCQAIPVGDAARHTALPATLAPTPSKDSPTASPSVTFTAATPATRPTITTTPTPIPTTATPTASPTTTPTQPVFEVRTHPDGGLFVGDQISLEVIAPPDIESLDDVLDISVDLGAGLQLQGQFAPFGIGGRNQATFHWAWDTSELEAGAYPISFAVQPLGYTWTQTVTLNSAAEVPPPEPLAEWASEESDCCLFHYVTDTAAAREITSTLTIADELAERAIRSLSVDFNEPLEVTLMPRVLGQGGFASSEIYISFLDRNYAGNSLAMVLHHEMVHILDYRLGGALRPTILIEGLAVYLSGGHYKPEDLTSRAASLLDPSQRVDGLGLGWYLPLRSLADDFYNAQHEIGYIQAGALVEYMVNTWGWEAYSAFYRDIQPISNGTQADALDAALQVYFDITLEELEADFLAMLQAQEIAAEYVDDLRLTVALLDTMRRYQQAFDPSAYFLTAWLPNGPLMRENGVVADLVRRPAAVENLALETLLVAANHALKAGDYEALEGELEAIDAVLDGVENGQPNPFEVHPLAKAHFEIALQLRDSGYQAEQIDVADNIARVVASQGWSQLTYFEFVSTSTGWYLANSNQ
jgi:hypothetical protein